ncbi:hypothetical protein ACC730_37680, partial [Rhizobium ruizarguesonis]
LAIGVENNADMSFKDTCHNIRMTEVFTVNIVSFAIAEAMHFCGAKYPRGVDPAILVDRRHQRDRPRDDRADHQLVAFELGELLEIE